MNRDAYDRDYIYVRYSGQALTGEKILRMEIEGVAIPYDGGAG